MESYKKLRNLRSLFGIHNSPFLILFVTFILLITFFVSSNPLSLSFSKITILSIGVTLSLIFFLINLLKNGNLPLPKYPIFLSLLGITIVYLVSSLLSGAKMASLAGYGFENMTFLAILVLTIFFLVTSTVFQTSKKLSAMYISLFIVSCIIAIFHISRLFFGTNFLSFGYFPEIISNTMGKWNELAIFFGATTIYSLMALVMLRLKPYLRVGAFICFLLSLCMLVVVNLTVVWYVLGAISLMLFVYFLSYQGAKLSTMNVVQSSDTQETKMKTSGRKISIGALVLVVVSFVFAFTPVGSDFTKKITQGFNINNLEVRPSWSATYEIAGKVLKENPVFGIGPNRFSTGWQLYRPDINLTNFWNVEFNSGIGFIPTSIIETGILGLVFWILFFVVFLFSGFRSFFRKSNDRLWHYFVASSFMVALYLWTIAILYMPSTPMLAMTFLFTGLSVASSYVSSGSTPKPFSLFKYQKLNFLVATVLVLVLVASVGLGYLFVEKVLAFSYFEKGLSLASNNGSLNDAASYMLRAENLSPNDAYYRSIAELNILRLNNVINSVSNQKEVSDDVKNEFQNVLASGLEASRRAQMWDKQNYQNWISSARVYELIVPIGVAGAADNARLAYEEALKYSPKNPSIYLALGRLEANQNDLNKAKEDVNMAIQLKNNYLEAIFFLSQIDAAQGNIQASANSIEKIFVNYPNDPNISFRLGILKYQLGDYAGAVKVLERSVSASPVYANARYFLGLGYEKIGRVPDAITQFEEIEKTNPDNEEVKLILSNLRAGRSSFASVKPPLDNKPEKRKQLPLVEDTK